MDSIHKFPPYFLCIFHTMGIPYDERTTVAIFGTNQVLYFHIKKGMVCSKMCSEAYTEISHLTPVTIHAWFIELDHCMAH